jgi:hypothetical protein
MTSASRMSFYLSRNTYEVYSVRNFKLFSLYFFFFAFRSTQSKKFQFENVKKIPTKTPNLSSSLFLRKSYDYAKGIQLVPFIVLY